ncbi:MAG: hypothetical protein RL684_904 [Pseudomonadota bacterium]|jgi:hypothetical protein
MTPFHRHTIAAALLGMAAMCCASARADTASAGDPLRPAGHWTGSTRGAARTPPMGWNSWNAFHTEVDEDKVMGAARVLVTSGLARLGYSYVNLDDGWWLRRRALDGRMQIRTGIFPSAATGGVDETSFKPFTNALHAMGLKAGIYTDVGRNACSQAYDLHSPNLPQGTTGEREVGLDGHVQQDIALYFGDWGFDYIKVDACGLADYAPGTALVTQNAYRARVPEIERASVHRTADRRVRQRYQEVADALHATRQADDYVLSICAWGAANVRSWGHEVGNLWRTSGDIVPSWTSMLHNFDSTAKRALYAGPGHWNDPDILFTGQGDFDEHHLTEARSHFALWAMMSAPLLISHDLRTAPQSLLDIWSNAGLIRVDQDAAGHQATVAYDSEDAQILVKTLGGGDRKAVALFNRGAAPVEITLLASHLKFSGAAPVALTDLWSGATSTFTGEQVFTLAPHETRVFEASGRRELEGGVYLSEIPGAIHVAVDGTTRAEADPGIHRMLDPWSNSRSGGSRPVYAGWGGAQADSTPYGQGLQIAGTAYSSGIGVLANSRLEIRHDARYTTFSADVGIDDSTAGDDDAARFLVYGDGRLLAATAAMKFGQRAQRLTADVSHVAVIELVVRARTGARGQPVVVTWAEAALSR